MKSTTKLICLTTLFILTFSIISYSQPHFKGISKKIDPLPELEDQFYNYEIYSIDSKAITAYLNRADYGNRIQLELGSQYFWDILLYPNDLRSKDYVLRIGDENGIQNRSRKRNVTYQGYLQSFPIGNVSLGIDEGFIFGKIDTEKGTFYIEPLKRFANSDAADLFVVYNVNAVRPTSKKCGVVDVQIMDEHAADQASLRAEGDCYVIDLAIASDFSMFTKYGSVGAVSAFSASVMNIVQTNYISCEFTSNINFSIVEQFVSTAAANDPVDASITDVDVILPGFRTWAYGASGFTSTYDLGQFWTNRDFDGTTIGYAYQGVVCDFSKFHILQDYSTNADGLRVLTAHEIGHNFGYGHDGDGSGFIMAPSVNNTNEWSDPSKTAINSEITTKHASGCLADCSTLGAPVTGLGASSLAICEGNTIEFKDASSNGPSTYSWSFPGGSPSSSSACRPSITYSTAGVYTASLSTSNSSGAGGTVQATVVVSEGPTTACAIGGSTAGAEGGILSFSLGSISNSTDDTQTDGSRLLDFSCAQLTSLEQGETYTPSFVVPFATNFQKLRIYIDYNNDGAFAASELALTSGGTGHKGGPINDYSFIVLDPAPVTNTILRMRVIGDSGFPDDCTIPGDGQAEDYGVVILDNSLPVTLAYFKGQKVDKQVELNWQTTNELNNDYFNLERSADGRNFETLAKIKGSGTTTSAKSYQFIDTRPMKGHNYYRLKQADFDGKTEYVGDMVLVDFYQNGEISIQPNPVKNNQVNLLYSSEEGNIKMETNIYNVNGQLMFSKMFDIAKGQNTLQVNVAELSRGIYFLETIRNGEREIQRFVIGE